MYTSPGLLKEPLYISMSELPIKLNQHTYLVRPIKAKGFFQGVFTQKVLQSGYDMATKAFKVRCRNQAEAT